MIRVLFVLWAAVFMTGCAGQKPAQQQRQKMALVFPMTAAQADEVIFKVVSAEAGSDVRPLAPPNIGYTGRVQTAQETSVVTLRAVPVVYGPRGRGNPAFVFEVHFVASSKGQSRARDIFERAAQEAALITPPLNIATSQITETSLPPRQMAGTGSASKLNRVRIGMNRSQVLTALGDPSDSNVVDQTEYLIYSLFKTANDQRQGIATQYYVALKDGLVSGIGTVGELDNDLAPGSFGAPPDSQPAGNSQQNIISKLRMLQQLKQDGVITEQEFQRLKQKIINEE